MESWKLDFDSSQWFYLFLNLGYPIGKPFKIL